MLGIGDSTPLEFLIDGERIVLRVYRPGCVFCGGVENLREYRDRQVCRACAKATVAAFERAGGPAPREKGLTAADGDTGARPAERAAREWVKRHLAARGWQVEESGREGGAFDLIARTQSRTWYVKAVVQEGEEPEWPSGRELGWLKAAAIRKNATAVLAFVRAQESNWSVAFSSAHARRALSASARYSYHCLPQGRLRVQSLAAHTGG